MRPDTPPCHHDWRIGDITASFADFSSLGDRLAFVFYDPWTVGAGLDHALTARIVDEGMRIAAFQYRALAEQDAEQIYRKNKPIRDDNAWHVPRQVYSMGVSCGIIFETDAQCSQRICRMKGFANPSRNSAGSLRYDFGAPNRSLSLMHSSDNWASMLAECLVFFTPDALRATFASVRSGPPGISPSALACDPWRRTAERIVERSPFRLLITVRERAATVVTAAMGAHVSPTLRRLLHQLITQWGSAAATMRDTDPILDQARTYLQLVHAECAMVADVAKHVREWEASDAGIVAYSPRLYCARTPRVLPVMELLVRLTMPERYAVTDAELLCDRSGLCVDRWERLLFVTTLFDFNDYISGVHAR